MQKLGLVLAGGGGKGAYQIGVWKYLRECGLDKNISAVAGTSVGALNAALFIQGDYELAEHIWLNEIHDKIVSFKSINKEAIIKYFTILGITQKNDILPDFLLSHGLFTRDGLISIIDEFLDLSVISNDSREIVATCLPTFCSIPKLSPTYFELNGCSPSRIKSILCATSALPGIFPKENIDGVKYIDGGLPIVGDNVPIRAMYNLGCDYVIAVHLSNDFTVNKEQFPNLYIRQIKPQNDLGNLLTGTLDFSSTGAMRRIEAGYNDAKNRLMFLVETAKIQQKVHKSCMKIDSDLERYKANLSRYSF